MIDLQQYKACMEATALALVENSVRQQALPRPRPRPGIVRITTYGCREYLRRLGLITEGELVLVDVTPKRLTIDRIKRAVGEHFNLPPEELVSARRARVVARPRQVAMYLCRHLTPQSLPQIGRAFGGRDHTTVMWALRQIDQLRLTDRALDSDVEALSRKLAA